MSTRCNILIKDDYSEQWFYRHSDGYPSCTANSLKTFVQWLIDGKIRDNVNQGSSWLIVLGNNETNKMIANNKKRNKEDPDAYQFATDHKSCGGGSKPCGGMMGWKVGEYEVTSEQHGDIQFLYTIDMEAKTVKIDYLYDEKEKTYTFEEFVNKKHEDIIN